MNKHPLESHDSSFNEGTLTLAMPDNHHKAADLYRALCLPTEHHKRVQVDAMVDAIVAIAETCEVVLDNNIQVSDITTIILEFSTNDYRTQMRLLGEDAVYPLLGEIEDAIINWKNQHVLRVEGGLYVLSLLQMRNERGEVGAEYFVLELRPEITSYRDSMEFFAHRGNDTNTFSLRIAEYLYHTVRMMMILNTPGVMQIPINSHTAHFVKHLGDAVVTHNNINPPHRHIVESIGQPEYGLPMLSVSISFVVPT